MCDPGVVCLEFSIQGPARPFGATNEVFQASLSLWSCLHHGWSLCGPVVPHLVGSPSLPIYFFICSLPSLLCPGFLSHFPDVEIVYLR